MLHHDSLTTLHFTGEEARSECVQLAICLHLGLVCMRRNTKIFAHATDAAKRAYKKISSGTVGTDVVVLVIHVVQQLRVDDLCVGENRWPSLV